MCRITFILSLILSGIVSPLFSQGESEGETIGVESMTPPTVITLFGLDSAYCETDLPAALFAEPAGGRFEGPISPDGIFYPRKVGKGVHTIRYIYETELGDLDSASLEVTVNQMPFAIVIDPSFEVFIGNRAKLQTGRNEISQGVWTLVSGGGTFATPDSSSSLVTDLPDGLSEFRYTISDGACSRSNTIAVTVSPFPAKRGFSPNGDGKNDLFVIQHLELYPGTGLQVFSRWGNLVYENEDYLNDWDGTNKAGDELSDDTYYYVLTLPTGEDYKGYIILKR